MLNLYSVRYDVNDGSYHFEYGAMAVVAAYDVRDAECVIEEACDNLHPSRLTIKTTLIGTPKSGTERGLVDCFIT